MYRDGVSLKAYDSLKTILAENNLSIIAHESLGDGEESLQSSINVLKVIK